MKLWDLAAAQEAATLKGTSVALKDVWSGNFMAFSPDGKELFTAPGRGTVQVWTLSSDR